MAEESPSAVENKVFSGQVSNANPHRLEPGKSVEQVNCQCEKAGELVVRKGFRSISFDN